MSAKNAAAALLHHETLHTGSTFIRRMEARDLFNTNPTANNRGE